MGSSNKKPHLASHLQPTTDYDYPKFTPATFFHRKKALGVKFYFKILKPQIPPSISRLGGSPAPHPQRTYNFLLVSILNIYTGWSVQSWHYIHTQTHTPIAVALPLALCTHTYI